MLRRKHAATPAPGGCFPDFLARITSNIEARRSIMLHSPLPQTRASKTKNNNSTLTQIMDSRFYIPQADSKKIDDYKKHSTDVCEVCLGNGGGGGSGDGGDHGNSDGDGEDDGHDGNGGQSCEGAYSII